MTIANLVVKARPIVVIANYRTLSTPLTTCIARINKIRMFSEPAWDNTRTMNSKNSFQNFYKKNKKNFVIKIMVDQLQDLPEYQKILNDPRSFKIKLNRKDIFATVTSFYISMITDRWYEHRLDTVKSYSVPIDESMIKTHIDRIATNYDLLENLPFKTNLELYSEDLSDTLEMIDQHQKKTTQPENYLEIYQVVKDIYKQIAR